MRQLSSMRDHAIAPGQLHATLGSFPETSRSNDRRPEELQERDYLSPSESNALPDMTERSIYGTRSRRGPYQQVIKALDLPAPNGIRDPVQIGIVSMQEMSAAWQM